MMGFILLQDLKIQQAKVYLVRRILAGLDKRSTLVFVRPCELARSATQWCKKLCLCYRT